VLIKSLLFLYYYF